MRVYFRVLDGSQFVGDGYAVRLGGETHLQAVSRSVDRRLAQNGLRTQIWAGGHAPRRGPDKVLCARGVVGDGSGRNRGNLELHIGLDGVRP